MRRRLSVLVVVVAGMIVASSVLAFSQPAAAAGPAISLTTSPVSLDLIIKPGTSTTKSLQLMNNSAQPLQIKVSLKVFGAYGQSGEAAITDPKAGDPSSGWVHFSPTSFTAQPGVWSQVQMSLNVPKTASLGYYYAVVFEPQVAPAATPGKNTVKGSNAILILVDTQSGNENRQVEIGSFSISKHVYEYLPVKFTVTVHNTGNIYLAPTGNIFVSRHSNISGTLAALDVNSAGANVLPNSSRNFLASWTDGFPVFQPKTIAGQPVTQKNGDTVEQLQWNTGKLSKFRFGKYYAQLALVYNNGQREVPLNAVVSFWVIPWKLLLGLLVILIILGFGVWTVGRNIVRRIRGVKGIGKPRIHKR